MTTSRRRGQRQATSFITKLYEIVSDPRNAAVIGWSSDGNQIVIRNEFAFTQHIMPEHFTHTNLSSFIRQLNIYDFHRKPSRQSSQQRAANDTINNVNHVNEPSDDVIFEHPYFKRDRADLLYMIQRKQTGQQSQTLITESEESSAHAHTHHHHNSHKKNVNDVVSQLSHDVNSLREQSRELLRVQQRLALLFAQWIQSEHREQLTADDDKGARGTEMSQYRRNVNGLNDFDWQTSSDDALRSMISTLPNGMETLNTTDLPQQIPYRAPMNNPQMMALARQQQRSSQLLRQNELINSKKRLSTDNSRANEYGRPPSVGNHVLESVANAQSSRQLLNALMYGVQSGQLLPDAAPPTDNSVASNGGASGYFEDASASSHSDDSDSARSVTSSPPLKRSKILIERMPSDSSVPTRDAGTIPTVHSPNAVFDIPPPLVPPSAPYRQDDDIPDLIRVKVEDFPSILPDNTAPSLAFGPMTPPSTTPINRSPQPLSTRSSTATPLPFANMPYSPLMSSLSALPPYTPNNMSLMDEEPLL